jgi:hypothetical protein
LSIPTTYKNSIEPPLPADHNAISGTHSSTVSAPHPKLYISSSS